jgi:hypothetical protein
LICHIISTHLLLIDIFYCLDTRAQLLFNATYLIESDASPEVDASKQVTWYQHFTVKRPARQNSAPARMSFIHYFGMDCDASDDHPLCFTLGKDMRDIEVDVHSTETETTTATTTVRVTGYSSLSGWFALTYTATDSVKEESTAQSPPLAVSYYGPKARRNKGGSGLPRIIEKISRAKDFMRAQKNNRRPKALPFSSDEGILFDDNDNLPNIVEANAVGVFVQFLSSSPLELHVEFASHVAWTTSEEAQTTHMSPADFSSAVHTLVDDFDQQFEEKFHLERKGVFSAKHVEVARRAMSALLGGLGYFHGSPVTGDSIHFVAPTAPFSASEQESVAVLPPNVLTLFSGTPSRSSFPRGFLWDEVSDQTLHVPCICLPIHPLIHSTSTIEFRC